MWYYTDYIDIRTDLVEVYSEEADRASPHRWKAFIPHDSFRELFSTLITALERGNPNANKSLWIYGSYGTGKTFASFTIKHLLEDNIPSVKEYLEKHDKVRDLTERFTAIRERGNWIVPYKSSSSHVRSLNILLCEIQNGVSKYLESQDLHKGQSFKEEILGYISTHPAVWKDIFEKNKLTEFSQFRSTEDVISILESDSSSSVKIQDKIVRLFEKEHILLLNTPDKLKKWLREVIEQNNLPGILFIWDEFTDYFQINSALSGFQELAHATQEIPFYLMLITHKSPDIFRNIKDMEKIFDRFHRIHLAMEPITAYELVGNSIEEKKELQHEWEAKKTSLWEEVKYVLSILDERDKENHLKKLIPLHPYTAYLLSIISRNLSSSQRSLFKFLKSGENNGFINFITKYPGRDEILWITPDVLWDYFFTQIHESDFPKSIREIVNYYETCKSPELEDSILTVFKTILLLIALNREIPDPKRLRPNLTNLKGCFWGVRHLDTYNIEKITLDLKTRGLIHIRKGFSGQEEYVLPLIHADEEEIKSIREELERGFSFNDFTRELEVELEKIFTPKPQQEKRHVFKVASYEELHKRREKVLKKLEPYQIGVVALVLQSDDERPKAEELCQKCSENPVLHDNILFLLLSPPFSQERFGQWKDNKAYIIYCEKKSDYVHKEQYISQAKEITRDWIRNMEIERHKIFFKGEIEEFNSSEYEEVFWNYASSIYPFGPERLISLATLYTKTDTKSPLEIGLGINKKPNTRYRETYRILEDFESNPEKYKPNTPLYEIRNKVKELLETTHSIKIKDIWNELQKPPFGLHPTPAGRILLGFAFREVLQSNFYIFDGNTCYQSSPQGIRDCLEKLTRDSKGSELLEIRKTSPQIEEFCSILRELFDIPEDRGRFPERLKNAIREEIIKRKYPIWAAKYTGNTDSEKLFLDLLSSYIQGEISIEEGTFLSNKELVMKIRSTLDNRDNLEEYSFDSKEIVAGIYLLSKEINTASFKEKIKTKHLNIGMHNFIKSSKPDLYDFIIKEKIDPFSAIKKLRNLLQEEVWLWKEKEAREKLYEVLIKLKLEVKLNELIGNPKLEWKDLLEEIKNSWLFDSLCFNLHALAEEVSQENKEPIINLAHILKDSETHLDEEERLAEFLSSPFNLQNLREALASSDRLLKNWIYEKTGYNISSEDYKEIAKTCHYLLLEEDLNKVKIEIKETCEKLSTFRLFKDLKERWLNLTGTKTPRNWTRKHLIPIEWILEDKDSKELISILDLELPEGIGTDNLARALRYIDQNKHQLTNLLSKGGESAFLEKLIPEAPNSIKMDKKFADNLRNYLILKTHSKVEDWPDLEPKLRKYAREYLAEHYNKIKKTILDKIHRAPTNKLINLLEELTEDPSIGLRIMEKLEE